MLTARTARQLTLRLVIETTDQRRSLVEIPVP
jgi:hypothetical protein